MGLSEYIPEWKNSIRYHLENLLSSDADISSYA